MQLPATPAFSSRRPTRKRLVDDREASSVAGSWSPRDELDREHRPEPADVSDLRPALLPALHARAHRVADRSRAGDEALILDHVEHRDAAACATGLPT